MADRNGTLAAIVAIVAGFFVAMGVAPAANAQQPTILFYQNSQDQARSIDVDTLGDGPTVSSFLGAIVGTARNIQADGDDGLLWYADTSGNIRSKGIATNAAGPTISSVVFAGANSGADRHFSLDPFTNRLYYSVTDGSVQIIDLVSATEVGSIPSTAFGGGIIGGFRHTTIDSVNRLLYYASTDDNVYSFSLDDPNVAGPTVLSGVIAGAAVGGFRHLIYDPNAALIWYSVTDGSVASVDPLTSAAGPTIASNLFTDIVGAGRIITLSGEVVPEPAALVAQGIACAVLALVARRRRLVSQMRMDGGLSSSPEP